LFLKNLFVVLLGGDSYFGGADAAPQLTTGLNSKKVCAPESNGRMNFLIQRVPRLSGSFMTLAGDVSAKRRGWPVFLMCFS
jgi:hypothetical protein